MSCPIPSVVLPYIAILAVAWSVPHVAYPQEEKAIDPEPESSNQRDFNEIDPGKSSPSVRYIAPLDGANIMFLDMEGRVGVAKFSPGLSLIGWDYYSSVQQEVHPGLVAGKQFSAITASYGELTQSFDTDEDFRIDFYQAVLRKWDGVGEGVVITAGPVADEHGRVLIALSPFKAEGETVASAKIVAWTPEAEEPALVMTSQLVVTNMAISGSGLIAALLELDNFPDYYVSVTELPPPPAPPKPEGESQADPATDEKTEEGADSEEKKEEVSNESETESKEDTEDSKSKEEGEPSPPVAPPPPGTEASLIIPSEMTDGFPPKQLSFFREADQMKLLLTSPETSRLIEVALEQRGEKWQGPILVRTILPRSAETIADMGDGRLLAGGTDGFFSGIPEKESFRIKSIRLVPDGISIRFSIPVDRALAIAADTFSVKTLPMQGGDETVITVPEPTVESDGYTVILPTEQLKAGQVLRLKCPDLQSESGAPLINPIVYYGLHEL